MRYVLIGVIVIHGLIHLMGFAKAFKFAELDNLKKPVSRPVGLVWLVAALLFGTAGALFLFNAPSWWWVVAPAVAMSQFVIISAWSDAKFGTIANLIILVPVVFSALEARPGSFTNRYRAAAREEFACAVDVPLVTQAELAHLPAPVRKYLCYAGVFGQPRIHNFRVGFAGDFRNGTKSRWMRFHSEQVNTVDPPTRLFLMKASMFGIPIEGLHMFTSTGATMQIKVASLFGVVDAKGQQMNQGETVTLFNDLCLMAPAALIDRERIRWESAGPLSASAAFTHMGKTIRAQLTFKEAGELVNFISADRLFSSDGKTYLRFPWSTPVRDYKEFDGRKAPSYGEAIWHLPEGEFCYGKFHLEKIEYKLKNIP